MIKKYALAIVMILALLMCPAFAKGNVTTIDGSPSGIVIAADGTMLVTDVWEKAVWKLDGGKAEKLAGAPGAYDLLGKATGGRLDGALKKASFQEPYDIVAYKNGYAVSDAANNTIRFIDANNVSTIAGSGRAGSRNGQKTAAEFNRPAGLACDTGGNLYIADSGNNSIRKMDSSGNVTLYMGGAEGDAVGTLSGTLLREPAGLSFFDGKLYVADAGNHRILVVDGDNVTVLAGGVRDKNNEDEIAGGSYRNGSAENAGFSNPQGVLAAEEGVFVADSGNGAVRLIKDGRVTTLWSNDGTYGVLYPKSPRGIALKEGTLYVCDLYTRGVFTLPAAPPEPPYTDIDNSSPDYEAARLMYQYRIFNGVSDNAFGPDGQMTRGQFITALGRLHSAVYPCAIIAGDVGFSDVAADMFYTGAVGWGAENNITYGVGGGLYSPDGILTREMMAVFFCRYAEYAGLDTSADLSALDAFPDGGAVSAWAADAMSWAVTCGIFQADEQGALAPGSSATRAQTARFFTDFMNSAF